MVKGMKKYKKFNSNNYKRNSNIIFIIVIIGIIVLSIGYSYYTDRLTINGDANAKYLTYSIEYVLNGGTNPENVVTSFKIIDEIPLPIPTRSQYTFAGWYDNERCVGTKITKTSDLDGDAILYAKWTSEVDFATVYRHDEEFVFTGENYIDTGVYLYNTENWQKDYEIGFTIEAYTPSEQEFQAIFVNTKNERGNTNGNTLVPGLVVRRNTTKSDIEITQTINNGVKVTKNVALNSLPMTIKVLRINGIVYYSINNNELIKLQDMNSFNNPYEVTTWFGAAEDVNGTPMRLLKGTLSNMYIKLGKYTPKKYTVYLNANGGTVSEQIREVAEFNTLGTLPIPTNNEGKIFNGWYTDLSFTNKVNENTIIDDDITLYAKWSNIGAVCTNGNYYSSLTEAIGAAPTNGDYITINLLEDISENVTIPAGKNIILDFQGYTFSNKTAAALIENKGNLKIIGGTFQSNGTNAVINNNKNSNLEITGGNIISNGTKQGVYNDGGNVTISGNPYIYTSSTIRAAAHNLNNGTMTITGGTIVADNFSGISNDAGTMTIGIKDGTINTNTPIIQGSNYGITSKVNYSIYDGIIKGKTESVNSESKITSVEDNSIIENSNEVIEGVTYKTLKLTLNNQ